MDVCIPLRRCGTGRRVSARAERDVGHPGGRHRLDRGPRPLRRHPRRRRRRDPGRQHRVRDRPHGRPPAREPLFLGRAEKAHRLGRATDRGARWLPDTCRPLHTRGQNRGHARMRPARNALASLHLLRRRGRAHVGVLRRAPRLLRRQGLRGAAMERIRGCLRGRPRHHRSHRALPLAEEARCLR